MRQKNANKGGVRFPKGVFENMVEVPHGLVRMDDQSKTDFIQRHILGEGENAIVSL